jgi:hypothetical protein
MQKQSQDEVRELEGGRRHIDKLSSFFKLTQIRRRMFQLTEANVSCNSLSTLVTCEHVNAALSSTRL